MKVVVQALVRDNGPWLRDFVTMLESIRHARPNLELDVHVWENDSKDDSRAFLEKCEKITLHGQGTESDSGDPRTVRLARYRNRLKDAVDLRGTDYVLLIDSGIWFGIGAFKHMLHTLETNSDIGMVAPLAIVRENVPCTFYYDTFATITMGGQKCDQFINLFPCETMGKTNKHAIHCHCVHGQDPLSISPSRYFDVKSTFGGFVLLRPESFVNAEWSVESERDCEHWKFCEGVRDAGYRVVIDRNAKVLWSEWA
jgi:hypothetical protein